jgi:hypothetical protein
MIMTKIKIALPRQGLLIIYILQSKQKPASLYKVLLAAEKKNHTTKKRVRKKREGLL